MRRLLARWNTEWGVKKVGRRKRGGIDFDINSDGEKRHILSHLVAKAVSAAPDSSPIPEG